MLQHKKTMAILVPVELHSQLKHLAEENGRSLSAYVRQILKRYLRHLAEHPQDQDWWRVEDLYSKK